MPLQGMRKATARQDKKQKDEEEREQKEQIDSNGAEDNMEEVIRCHLHVAHLFQSALAQHTLTAQHKVSVNS